MMYENRKQYPDLWESLATACKADANWTCQHCGIYSPPDNPAVRYGKKTGYPYFVYLHAAHKNHDKGNPTPELLCLCVACHSRYDYHHKQRQKIILLEQLKHLRLLIKQGMITVAHELPTRYFE